MTVERPKVLLPLVNVPMINYTLEWLLASGVDEVRRGCDVQRLAEAFDNARDWSGGSRMRRTPSAGNWAAHYGSRACLHHASVIAPSGGCRRWHNGVEFRALQILVFCSSHASQVQRHLEAGPWLRLRTCKVWDYCQPRRQHGWPAASAC